MEFAIRSLYLTRFESLPIQAKRTRIHWPLSAHRVSYWLTKMLLGPDLSCLKHQKQLHKVSSNTYSIRLGSFGGAKDSLPDGRDRNAGTGAPWDDGGFVLRHLRRRHKT